MNDEGKTLVAFVLGIAAGTLLGLTISPASGKRNRKKINDSANGALYDLEDVWEDGVERIKEIAEIAVEELEKYSKKMTKDM